MTNITCLVDNSPAPSGATSLAVEHGLSFWIEHASVRILFDTGRSPLFLANAGALGVDPAAADHVVISHGHYDHANGLTSLFAPFFRDARAVEGPRDTRFLRPHTPLWLGTGFFVPKWSIEPGNNRFIEASWSEGDAKAANLDVRYTGQGTSGPYVCEIEPGISLVGGFFRRYPQESIAARMQLEENGVYRQDDFADEHALVLDMGESLALVIGCAHPGIMNMIETIGELFDKPLSAVFGGSHLVEADAARIDETIDFLNDSRIALAALGHCTGAAALSRLKESCPAWKPLHAGARFVLDD